MIQLLSSILKTTHVQQPSIFGDICSARQNYFHLSWTTTYQLTSNQKSGTLN